MVDYQGILKEVGDKSANISEPIIQKLLNLGLEVSNVSAKLINLIVVVALIWLLIKFSGFMNKPIKWILIILLGLLGISILVSFQTST